MNCHQVHSVLALKGADDLIRLSQAQHTVIDKDAGELVAHGTVNQSGHHRRVDSTGEPAQYTSIPHLLAD